MEVKHDPDAQVSEDVVKVVYTDSRAISGDKPEAPEVHGSVNGFIPAGDYVLIRRLEAVAEESGIIRPEAYVELAERGVVIAASRNVTDYSKPGETLHTDGKRSYIPVGVIAKFSKYGAEEIHFDDEGQNRYVLVRMSDIRGWHASH